jgi:hypothetical protein
MKSKNSNDQISIFLKENSFVKSVVIYHNGSIMFHPSIQPDKESFFKQIIDECIAKYPEDTDCFLITENEYICILKRKLAVYICETMKNITVSQVKMELETLVENITKNQNNKGKLTKIFSSFFDR